MKFTIYTADCTGNEKNTLYPNQRVITCEGDLKKSITADHVCAKYQNNTRSDANFIVSDVVPMDCDNDHSDNSDEWITPEILADNLIDVAFAITYSRHHMLSKGNKSARPRFHVFFPTAPCNDALSHKAIKAKIYKELPFFDGNALDASRFLFGCPSDVYWHEGSLSIEDWLTLMKSNRSIPQGQRNSTMSRIAGKLVKRFGVTDTAYQKFLEKAAECEPPLPDDELETIWRSACKFGKKVASQDGYISPEEYGKHSLIPEDFSDVGEARTFVDSFSDEVACASKILFESEGVSGYSAESFRAWKETARCSGNCSEETGSGLMFENHSQATRYTGPLEVAQTVSATYGTGGNNQPFVVESAGFCTEHSAKAHGIGYEEEKAPTLRAGVVPATLKVYGICSEHSNSMMSDNPNSGFYEADTARTIDTSNQSPCKNQGGMVVIEGNGSRPSHHGDGYKESETMYTLNCTENHAVSYGIGRPAMNQSYNARFSFQIEEETSPTIVASGAGGIAHPIYSTSKNSHHTIAEKEKANTLVASDYKDPPLVNDSTSEIEYIVRRLTPQECALLQGMPTWWCDDLGTENPTDTQIDWWQNVFENYNKAIGKECKPKSRKQIEKWLKNPYSDSAAYKMWGNGIAACNAWFVLAGISHYAKMPIEIKKAVN